MLSQTRPPKVGKWTEPALRVLRERYLTRKGDEVLETPEEMCWRVSQCLARAEERWGKSPGAVQEVAAAFYDLMVDGYFLPNSPTLMNAGKGNRLQFSACYVLPVGDSMEEIFDAVKAAAIIHKCLVGDTFVMSNGLSRLSEVQDGALLMTDEGPLHVSGLHDNGEQPVFEVRTNRGYRVVGTAEHRLLAVAHNGSYEWRKIGEIREGDWLIMKPGPWTGGETKLPAFTPPQKPGRNRTSFKAREYRLPRELTPELAELIGLYIGDGWNHRDGIRFTVGGDCPEVVEKIKELSLALFGKVPSMSKYTGENAIEVAILSTQIKEWFAFLGITKVSSREAQIPEIILRSPEEVACAFVRGLFTADGCVRENGHIALTTSSRRLGEELQIMLLGLGVPTHLRHDISSTHYESWQLSVSTKTGALMFREKIGFAAAEKAARLTAVDDREIFVPPSFEKLASEEFFFVRATAIDYAGIRRVYDLTVPVKHAYIANGFVSHNSGGGTGFAFSRLRPKDDVVASTGGKASGPVSFLRVFNGATEAVKQGGTRRGANMGILKVDHPDILEFIECKLDGGITNFNISVAATDRFMDALEKGADYELINPHTGAVVGKLSAREVFERIVRAAWRTGDPGMVFIDRINRSPANPTPEVGMVEATNPCGEQPLLPNEACNLGSLNVSKFARRPDGGEWAIDWEDLERVVRLSVRFLDDVIEMNPYPLPEIDATVKANRRIGLGIMGWADLLFIMGIPYDSQEALDLAEQLMAFVKEQAHDQSAKLAEERGPFPNWSRSIYRHGRPMRNSTVTTIAPTGTISMIAGCSSGIEPIFALAFEHRVKQPDGERVLTFVNDLFERIAREQGCYSEALMQEVLKRGSLRGIPGVPESAQQIFKTSHEIPYEWHVRHQAAFQKYTDNGVSKTINLPNSATEEDVAQAYRLAWQMACLGITVFRDGCKGEQVLNVGVGAKAKEEVPTPTTGRAVIKPRPHSLGGVTYRMETPIGTAFITVNQTGDGEPFEVFVQVGKGGSDTMAVAEALGRLISLILRLPSPFSANRRMEEVINQLSRIGGGQPTGFGSAKVLSLPDALARTLAEHLGQVKAEAGEQGNGSRRHRIGDLCKECGQATFIYEEGCKKCLACGYNEC
jgi:ribonucleoside-diphosphate reductase alpha chain